MIEMSTICKSLGILSNPKPMYLPALHMHNTDKNKLFWRRSCDFLITIPPLVNLLNFNEIQNSKINQISKPPEHLLNYFPLEEDWRLYGNMRLADLETKRQCQNAISQNPYTKSAPPTGPTLNP